MERYDVFSSLAQSHGGISFRQLLHSDGKDAERNLWKLLMKTTGLVATVGDVPGRSDNPRERENET